MDESSLKEPCSDRDGSRQQKQTSTPLKPQLPNPEESTDEPEDLDKDLPSFAPSQLQYCTQADTSKHSLTQLDAQAGDSGHDAVEEVTMQPCDNTRLADTHEATSEPANEEIEQYQVPETCNTAGSRPQGIRRAPVRMTYDVPGQPAYYPAVTTNLHTALVAPNPVPAWFGMTPPYQPVWYWPQCTVPFQPMYSLFLNNQ